MVSLSESVVVITGAASGMGRSMAHEFADAGANVVAVDVDEDGVKTVADEIETAGGEAIALYADVTDTDSVSEIVDRTVEEYGTIDVLCNNAGVLDDYASVEETSDELWHGVLGVNLNGPFYLTRAALPALREGEEEGVVINTASIAGKVAGGGGSAYTASKHGLIGFTKQLAHDYGPEIRANAICPGAVETGMTDELIEEMEAMTAETPAKRYAAPEEIANAAVFLASDDASFVYGTAVDVDGGWLVD